MKQFIVPMSKLCAVVALCAIPAYAATEIRTQLTGSGTASDSDRSSADAQAYDQAATQANSMCVGTVESTVKTMDSCIKLGDADNPQYVCTVMVRIMCVITRY